MGNEEIKVKQWRVLIVDDERLARDRLKELLENIPNFIPIGEATNGIEALEKIETLQPDIVLLDIEMRGLTGFDVIEALDKSHLPQIVFVTAYDEYALKAFEVSAADYLLKPVSGDRLRNALQKCEKLLPDRVSAQIESLRSILAQGHQRYLQSLIGRKGSRFYVIAVKDVCYIQIESQIVYVATLSGRFWTNYTLTSLEPRLDPETFLRVNRRCIVNLHHVKELAPIARGVYEVRLSNGQDIEASRQYAPLLKKHLGWD